jgi:lactate permease
MWEQVYIPFADNLALSTLLASIPLLVLLLMIGILRKPSWMASLSGLVCAFLMAVVGYGMPIAPAVSAVLYGAAFGLFPICWIIFNAILLYQITVKTGRFEVIKDSLGALTTDRRLQALLIAFSFGAFLEGAAGFGSPVAVAAAMLTGLGFTPFNAAVLCLLANTAPVAFGSIGIPIITLAGITGLPVERLSAGVGRICAPVSLFIPAYLVTVMSGFRGMLGVFPAALACGLAFAGTQFLVSNFLGPQLTDILGSLAAMGSLILVLALWKPSRIETNEGVAAQNSRLKHSAGAILHAWMPYLFLVVFILAWGLDPVKKVLDFATVSFGWPGLHDIITRVAPVVDNPAPYAAIFKLDFLAAAGTACLASAVFSAVFLRMSFADFFSVVRLTARQLALPTVTISGVLALAFLMNYSGATMTLGLAFAATGQLFPFFSAILGWLGVFLTGSDTSANALFGNLQVVTARQLDLNAVLMASANSSGGVMGKMISLQSIAVAVAATGMAVQEEAKLFRFTLRHSIFLAVVIGLIAMAYAYVVPSWAP